MLKGVNDSEDDARRLIGLLKGIPAKVNLIPFNPWPGSFFECSEAATITRFADRLSAAHISAPARATRGDDILAASGQPKSASARKKTAERDAAAAACSGRLPPPLPLAPPLTPRAVMPILPRRFSARRTHSTCPRSKN